MFKSATFKLTMWYLAIVMIISLGFSLAVYHFATGELSSGLSHQTQRIFNEYPVFNGNPGLIQHQDNDVAFGEHHILWRLAYFNLLVLVAAGFASYFLARRTLEPIEAAHEQQKRFTADVSHELRTPLTSLKMGSEVALMDKQADKRSLRETLESNLEDVGKMELLINSLLRLTKLDNESAQAAFGPIHTQDVVKAAMAQLKKVAAIKQISIDSTGKDVVLLGDQESLVQLLVILLENAIKYSPEKSKVALAVTHDDTTASFSVRDDGQGIAPEALPHVFDRFYRADKARNNASAEGFGLGLSIAKLIADRHNGTITLSSHPGNGTTAVVLLPIRADV